MAKVRTRKRRWWLPPLVIVIVLFFAGYSLTILAAARLKSEKEHARATGMIVSEEEREALKPQSIRDAYPIYLAAHEELRKLPKGAQTILRHGYELFPPNSRLEQQTRDLLGRDKLLSWTEVRDVSQSAFKVFDLMEQATKRPEFFDPDSRSEGARERFLDLMFACKLSAVAAAEEGDFISASRFLTLARKMSATVFGFPSFLKMLQGIGLDLRNEDSLRRIILMTTNETDLNRVAFACALNSPLPSLKNALRLEALGALQDVSYLADSSELTWRDSDFWRFRTLRLSWIGDTVKARALRLLSTARARLPADPLDYPGTQEALRDLESVAAKDTSFTGRFVPIFLDVYSSAPRALAPILISHQGDEILIEIQRAKIFKRTYPTELPPKARAILDPMSGKPFHYRQVPTGFQLYSVGIDGKDDGGGLKSDVVFELRDGRIQRRY